MAERGNTTHGSSLKAYADLYRLPGPWCTAYVDAGTGTVDSLEAGDVRAGNTRAQLEAQGATSADIDAMEQALTPATGMPSPVSRFVLVHGGKAELNEVLPGRVPLPASGRWRASPNTFTNSMAAAGPSCGSSTTPRTCGAGTPTKWRAK